MTTLVILQEITLVDFEVGIEGKIAHVVDVRSSKLKRRFRLQKLSYIRLENNPV